MNKIMVKSALAAAFTALSVAAMADTISYTGSISGPFSIDDAQIALPRFNPALGTLQSVSISFSGSSYTTGTVQNTSGTTYGFPALVWDTTDISVLGNSVFDSALAALNPNANTYTVPDAWLELSSPKFNITGLAPGAIMNIGGANTAASGGPASVSGITSGTVFTDLMGMGNQLLDIDIRDIGNSAIYNGGSALVNTTVIGTVNATVTYIYANPVPVPEPGALTLLGCGVAALGTFGWRRRG